MELEAEKPPFFSRREEETWDHSYADFSKGVEYIIGRYAESSRLRTQGQKVSRDWF
jgi:hypothetical protein